MPFPDEEVKLKSGRVSNEEREIILQRLGEIAQEKYDEFIVQGGNAKGYNLEPLKGSLKFETDVNEFDNVYWLENDDPYWTDVAIYFEYGTGIFNQKRAGKYRGGYIKPTTAKYLKFVAKDGNFVMTKRVKGVHPIFAMEKTITYINFNRARLQRKIRQEIYND